MTPSPRSIRPPHRKHWRGLAAHSPASPPIRLPQRSQERAQTPSGYPHPTAPLIGAPEAFQGPSWSIGLDRLPAREHGCLDVPRLPAARLPQVTLCPAEGEGGFEPPAGVAERSVGPTCGIPSHFHEYPTPYPA